MKVMKVLLSSRIIKLKPCRVFSKITKQNFYLTETHLLKKLKNSHILFQT